MVFNDYFKGEMQFRLIHMEATSRAIPFKGQIVITDGYTYDSNNGEYTISVNRSVSVPDEDEQIASVQALITLHPNDDVSEVPYEEREVIDAFIDYINTTDKAIKIYSQISYALSSMTAIMNDPPIITPPIPFKNEPV